MDRATPGRPEIMASIIAVPWNEGPFRSPATHTGVKSTALHAAHPKLSPP